MCCSIFSCESDSSDSHLLTNDIMSALPRPLCPPPPTPSLGDKHTAPVTDSSGAFSRRWQSGLKTKNLLLGKPSGLECHVLWPGILIRNVICCHKFKVMSLRFSEGVCFLYSCGPESRMWKSSFKYTRKWLESSWTNVLLRPAAWQPLYATLLPPDAGKNSCYQASCKI